MSFIQIIPLKNLMVSLRKSLQNNEINSKIVKPYPVEGVLKMVLYKVSFIWLFKRMKITAKE